MTISVVIPVYNVEPYLRECLDSVVNQTYRNLQIILVDDGSTDASGAICDEYGQKDGRVRVIHKRNGGQADARNVGLSVATGEYISFIDSDDYIHTGAYELLINYAKTENADLVTFANTKNKNDIYISAETNVIFLNGKRDFDKIISLANTGPCNKLYRRIVLEGFAFPAGKLHEDEYIHRMVYKCEKIVHVPQNLYFYRMREGSTMHTFKESKVFDALEAFEDRIRFAQEKGWGELLRPAVNQYAQYCVNEYFAIKKMKDKKHDHLLRHLRKCLSEKIAEFGGRMFWRQYVAFNCGVVPYRLCLLLGGALRAAANAVGGSK